MQGSESGKVHAGGCVCGAVRFRTAGAPLRVGLCHCLDCRKAHAAPFSAFAVFPAESVTLTDDIGGELPPDSLSSHDNGRGYRRDFCRNCGSSIRSVESGTSEVELYLGLFDETSLWQPTYELWIKRREEWLDHLGAIANRYEEDRPTGGLAIG